MRVKFCGITRPEDAHEAVRLGAWAIGLNQWSGSPRRCDPATAVAISSELRRKVEVAGVFVNASLDEIAAAVEDIQLSMVQLHGDEGPAFCAEAARRTGCKVIKAVRVGSGADLQALERFHTDYHLLDAAVPGRRGGTGEAWDWALAAQRRSSVPAILSGGLTPENVAAGIAAVRPWAVDVASGVEAAPGVKDPRRLEAFFAAAAPATVAP
jgi:phosphoribosylanthranilate isomerase